MLQPGNHVVPDSNDPVTPFLDSSINSSLHSINLCQQVVDGEVPLRNDDVALPAAIARLAAGVTPVVHGGDTLMSFCCRLMILADLYPYIYPFFAGFST